MPGLPSGRGGGFVENGPAEINNPSSRESILPGLLTSAEYLGHTPCATRFFTAPGERLLDRYVCAGINSLMAETS